MDYFKDLLDYTTDYWVNGVNWVASCSGCPHLRLLSVRSGLNLLRAFYQNLSNSFLIALSACSNLWVGRQYVFLVVPSGYFLGLPGEGWVNWVVPSLYFILFTFYRVVFRLIK